MRVIKFGGTSVRDAERLRRAVRIAAARGGVPVVVVVSAGAGVTRSLLELGFLAADMRDNAVGESLGEIRRRQLGVLDELALDRAPRDRARARLRRLLGELEIAVDRISADGRYDEPRQDALLSFGERFSSALFLAAASGVVSAGHIAATEVIVTDDRFRAATPDPASIARNTRSRVRPLLRQYDVLVTEGFIGATSDGRVTTMGFEASDLSASLLGAALEAEEVQIWTDVPGMLTCGHRAAVNARVVPTLTFDEAEELALFGAKVLHPASVAPARDAGIPVRILMSSNPAGVGTFIDGRARSHPPTLRIRGIGCIENLDDDSFAAARTALRSELAGEPEGQSIVCPVGEGIGGDAALRARVLSLVERFEGVAAGPERPHAIPIAVPREHTAAAVALLHSALLPI